MKLQYLYNLLYHNTQLHITRGELLLAIFPLLDWPWARESSHNVFWVEGLKLVV